MLLCCWLNRSFSFRQVLILIRSLSLTLALIAVSRAGRCAEALCLMVVHWFLRGRCSHPLDFDAASRLFMQALKKMVA
jgi:hypothetical protein